MPKGPKGQKRPADVISNAVHLTRVATGEIEDTAGLMADGKSRAAVGGVSVETLPSADCVNGARPASAPAGTRHPPAVGPRGAGRRGAITVRSRVSRVEVTEPAHDGLWRAGAFQPDPRRGAWFQQGPHRQQFGRPACARRAAGYRLGPDPPRATGARREPEHRAPRRERLLVVGLGPAPDLDAHLSRHPHRHAARQSDRLVASGPRPDGTAVRGDGGAGDQAGPPARTTSRKPIDCVAVPIPAPRLVARRPPRSPSLPHPWPHHREHPQQPWHHHLSHRQQPQFLPAATRHPPTTPPAPSRAA